MHVFNKREIHFITFFYITLKHYLVKSFISMFKEQKFILFQNKNLR